MRVASHPFFLLLSVLLAGLILRLLLAPIGGYEPDIDTMRSWAVTLETKPLSRFYSSVWADHLPGDLWILWAIAKGYHLFSPGTDLHSAAFRFLLKLVPALADTGIGLILYVLVRRLWGSTVGLVACCLFLFNPASIFLTSVWGQWDSVSSLFALAALWLCVRGTPEWALPVLTCAILIKPQFAALGPLFLIAYAVQYILPHTAQKVWGVSDLHPQREPLNRSFVRLLGPVVMTTVVSLAVLAPFHVGPRGLLWRMQEAWNVYPLTTVFAFNVWAIPIFNRGSYMQPDSHLFLFQQSYRVWGEALLVVAYLTVLVRYWLKAGHKVLIWACLATSFALYLLATRSHERYLFPAIVFAALLAGMGRTWLWVYVLLSVTYLMDLYYSYALQSPDLPAIHAALFIAAVSVVNTVLFLYVLFVVPSQHFPRPLSKEMGLHATGRNSVVSREGQEVITDLPRGTG